MTCAIATGRPHLCPLGSWSLPAFPEAGTALLQVVGALDRKANPLELPVTTARLSERHMAVLQEASISSLAIIVDLWGLISDDGQELAGPRRGNTMTYLRFRVGLSLMCLKSNFASHFGHVIGRLFRS